MSGFSSVFVYYCVLVGVPDSPILVFLIRFFLLLLSSKNTIVINIELKSHTALCEKRANRSHDDTIGRDW